MGSSVRAVARRMGRSAPAIGREPVRDACPGSGVCQPGRAHPRAGPQPPVRPTHPRLPAAAPLARPPLARLALAAR
jgi:hypothetical protein